MTATLFTISGLLLAIAGLVILAAMHHPAPSTSNLGEIFIALLIGVGVTSSAALVSLLL